MRSKAMASKTIVPNVAPKVSWASQTHRGNRRPDNQDSLLADGRLFVVADGLGGHKGGATASALAVKILTENMSGIGFEMEAKEVGKIDPEEIGEKLREAFDAANEVIYKTAKQNPDELEGMGTTLCALYILETDVDASDQASNQPLNSVANSDTNPIAKLSPSNSNGDALDDTAPNEVASTNVSAAGIVPISIAANVGDSRLYQFTDDKLTQITLDHNHGLSSHLLTRAIGIEPEVETDIWFLERPSKNEKTRYLLCTDGLTNEVDGKTLERELRSVKVPASSKELQKLADKLSELALKNGGRDNITLIILDVE